MRTIRLLFVCSLFLVTLVSAQTATPSPKPSPDYSQEAFVTEHYIESFRFENDGTGREQIDARIKINSDSGVQALGQLKVGYSALSDKLEVVYVRVIKPDGTVITAQESAIQDLTIPDAPVYTDYHEKHISVPSLRPGDVLEYQFVRTIVNPLTPGQFWTSYDFKDRGIVLDEQLEINVPKSRQIKLKSEPGAEPKITDEGDRRIYRWKHSHLDDDEEAAKRRSAPCAGMTRMKYPQCNSPPLRAGSSSAIGTPPWRKTAANPAMPLRPRLPNLSKARQPTWTR